MTAPGARFSLSDLQSPVDWRKWRLLPMETSLVRAPCSR